MTTGTISKEDFKGLVMKLEKAFSFPLPTVRLEILYKALSGMKPETIRKGIEYLINTKPYMPVNADIIISCRVAQDQEWKETKERETHISVLETILSRIEIVVLDVELV